MGKFKVAERMGGETALGWPSENIRGAQEDPRPDVLPPGPAISVRPDPSSHVLLTPMCGLQ